MQCGCSLLSFRAFHLGQSFLRKSLGPNEVRKKFINYFERQGHRHVPSTSVIPFNDPSLDFVNAGMNQFKRVFLGMNAPPHPRVVNYQRCIRVGGKHNDLKLIGTDGYHHTFFEMLGSWTFQSCNKLEACKQAWEFLTGEMGLNENRLYVTYFEGSTQLGLPTDVETQEIWRSLGVPDERIIAFGCSDNFWEMGSVGPCGPCTEIHYDHLDRRGKAASRVNTGGQDMVELWNLVFIQYNREEDGSLTKLPSPHLDTGMGLERLTAVLAGSMSNYDTEVFTPLFKKIQEVTSYPGKYMGRWGEQDTDGIDTAYRKLADHVRMVSVSLADGALPSDHHRVRRLIRRSLWMLRQSFKSRYRNFAALVDPTLDGLAEAYPALGNANEMVKNVLQQELYLFKNHREQMEAQLSRLRRKSRQLAKDLEGPLHVPLNEEPGFIKAYHLLSQEGWLSSGNTLTGDFLFKLHNAYGVSEESLEVLASVYNLSLDWEGFRADLESYKKESLTKTIAGDSGQHINLHQVSQELHKQGIPKTNDEHKYVYHKEGHTYTVPSLQSSILKIVREDNVSSEALEMGDKGSLLLERTNLYSEAGGQVADLGIISTDEGTFAVQDVQSYAGYVYHIGQVTSGQVKEGMKATLQVDVGRRKGCAVHHTATHLINAVLKDHLGFTSQKSSLVTDEGLKFSFSGYFMLPAEVLMHIEKRIKDIIEKGIAVKRSVRSLNSIVEARDVTLMSGEIYPDPVSIIEISTADGSISSTEPCCGTHAIDTGDIEALVISRHRQHTRGVYDLQAVTGDKARELVERGKRLKEKITELEQKFVEEIEPLDRPTLDELKPWKKLLRTWQKSLISGEIPQVSRLELSHRVNNMLFTLSEKTFRAEQILKGQKKEQTAEADADEWHPVMELLNKEYEKQKDKGAVVALIDWEIKTRMSVTECLSLVCMDLPFLVIFKQKGKLKTIARVPKESIRGAFTAKSWVESLEKLLESKGANVNMWPPEEIYKLEGRPLKDDTSEKLKEACNVAQVFVKEALNQS